MISGEKTEIFSPFDLRLALNIFGFHIYLIVARKSNRNNGPP